ncbi:MAG TPA: NAD(P)/FAD-dependent oxidoreductase [Caulobacteraceae bacterium]|jgi:thioredoxin reductase (NADPH)
MTDDGSILDALVIGAGPAGLTAAIYLARFRRRFEVIHDGQSRAGWIPISRNHPGFPDGVAGRDLLQRMRTQAERFGAVITEGVVERINITDGLFTATVGGRGIQARTVLLATGVIDTAPNLPGVEAAVRKGLVRICPICDGYEVTGEAVAVIGADDRGGREARFLTTYSDRVSLIHVGPPDALGDDERRRLAVEGVEVIETTVESVSLDNDRISALCFTGSGTRTFDSVYSALGTLPRCELAVGLGARTGDDGRLTVDDHQETTVRGLFAAGDMVRGLNQISTAEGEAAIAATAIHNRLRERG